MSTRVLRTAPTLVQRAARLAKRLQLARLRFHIDCLVDEREHYRALGWTGPVYMRESYAMQRQLMTRVRVLEASL